MNETDLTRQPETNDKTKFDFVRVSPKDFDRWDSFVESSPDGTLFSKTEYLKSIRRDFSLYLVKKGDSVRAGFAVIDADTRVARLDDSVIYNGLMYAQENKYDQFNHQKRLSNRFQLAESLIEFLTAQYDRLEFSLWPGVTDIRPFLWHNYAAADPSEKFRLSLRYTSLLDLTRLTSGYADEQQPLFQELGVSRRQEIRYARKDGASAIESDRVEDFLELYTLTMKKNGSLVNDFEFRLTQMASIMKTLLTAGSGRLFVVEKDGELLSGAFFGWDSKRAYYLFGGSHPEKLNRYAGTIVLWDSLRNLSLLGVREVDLEGVNSPRRGWFKLSFGGTLTPYHQLTL